MTGVQTCALPIYFSWQSGGASARGNKVFFWIDLKTIIAVDSDTGNEIWRYVGKLSEPDGLPLNSPVISSSTLYMMTDRKSTRLNSSHIPLSRMPSSA